MRVFMKRWLTPMIAALLLVFTAVDGAWAQTKEEAARNAARQYNAKVLSVKTVQEGNRKVYVIKLLTRDGVVKTVRVTARDR